LAAKNQVVVYSKPGCCLCDEVKSKLRRLQQTRLFDWEEVNVLDDPAASAKFGEEIPVIFVNGCREFAYHLDEDRFLRLLL
jgi:glutaredoxin